MLSNGIIDELNPERIKQQIRISVKLHLDGWKTRGISIAGFQGDVVIPAAGGEYSNDLLVINGIGINSTIPSSIGINGFDTGFYPDIPGYFHHDTGTKYTLRREKRIIGYLIPVHRIFTKGFERQPIR